MITEKDKLRFENFFTKDKDDCWIWQGGKNKCGYGIFNYKDKCILAHRFSWMLYKGDIPEDLCVCHKCDIRNCQNPKHLWLGTHKDNMQDAVKKGRLNLEPMLKSMEGKPFSEEHKKNISLSHKGKPSPRLGEKHSEESKKKMSLAHKKRWICKKLLQASKIGIK
jgi:hypothetical protein